MLRAFILLSLIAGFSAKDCILHAKLKQKLLNHGFHRNITYSITLDHNLGQDLSENCEVAVSQALPKGVFANPDELDDFRRLQKLHTIMKNRVNVELPAEESESMAVFIVTELNGRYARTWLPVHARYHRAAEGGGFVTNHIPFPSLYLRCTDHILDHCAENYSTLSYFCDAESKEMCTWVHVPASVPNSLHFDVPIGDTSSYYIVSAVTAAAVVAGSLYLLKTLHDYKIKQKHL